MLQQFLCHCLKFLLQYSYLCHFSVSRQLVLLSTSIRHLFHTKKSLFEHVQDHLAWSNIILNVLGSIKISKDFNMDQISYEQMVLQGFSYISQLSIYDYFYTNIFPRVISFASAVMKECTKLDWPDYANLFLSNPFIAGHLLHDNVSANRKRSTLEWSWHFSIFS